MTGNLHRGKNGIGKPYAAKSSLQCKRWPEFRLLVCIKYMSPVLKLLKVKRGPLQAQPKNII